MVLSGDNIGQNTPNEVVLVTGATGFIGTYLVDILKSASREVRVYFGSSTAVKVWSVSLSPTGSPVN